MSRSRIKFAKRVADALRSEQFDKPSTTVADIEMSQRLSAARTDDELAAIWADLIAPESFDGGFSFSELAEMGLTPDSTADEWREAYERVARDGSTGHRLRSALKGLVK